MNRFALRAVRRLGGYRGPFLPVEVAVIFRSRPGNYVLVARDGRLYAGKTNEADRRIDDHMRDHRGVFAEAYFRPDDTDTEDARTSQEVRAITGLLLGGARLRNIVFPSPPRRASARGPHVNNLFRAQP